MKKLRRALVFTLALMLVVVGCLWTPAAVGADRDYSVIRVWLKSLSQSDSISLRVQGDYAIDGQSAFVKKDSYTLSVQSGKLVLQGGGQTLDLGTRAIFRQYASTLPDYANTIAINVPGIGWRNYPGNLVVSINESGKLHVVTHVYMEEYLRGVVAAEIGESSPKEALKAQAICSRSYAIYTMKYYAQADYDLDDSTSYQAYRGISSDTPNSKAAIEETAGQIITYNGDVALGYYSSSNGGWTETNYGMYGRELPYTQYKEDPYDVAADPNQLYRKTLVFPKVIDGATADTTMLPALLTYVTPKVAAALDEDWTAEGAPEWRITGTKAILLHTPYTKYLTDRRFTKADVTFTVARTVEKAEETDEAEETEATEQKEATEQTADVTVTLELRSTGGLKDTFGQVYNNYKMLLLTEQEKGFELMMAFPGHGIGMSQTGAIYMAKKGWTASEIIHFYYKDVEIVTGSSPVKPEMSVASGCTTSSLVLRAEPFASASIYLT
nr:SpoIID/LytB domain-containing protein [bacterium]